ncbi:MAG: hypothetical protein GTO17_11295 [Candidatus Aminicenantes bacterium]|nr:hypothetical protein [Candidatus Aminicenantes bacterium]
MDFLSLKKLFAGLVFLLSLASLSLPAGDDDVFTMGAVKISPGEMRSGYLPVPEKEGIRTLVPFTVIHGSRKGKVLALVAGVHGYEYPPILALYRLRKMIDPDSLAGTLIMIHVANLPAFQRRIIYYGPYDWKNLNRVFPGDPQGTISQRIAFVLKEAVIEKSDYLIDLHCGDGNEALIPYAYWMIKGDQEIDQVTKKMLLAFGLKYIIIDKTRSRDISHSKYLGNTAILLSKPAITTESGYLGKTDEISIVRNVKGILNIMRLFKMIEGEPEFITEPVWIEPYEVIYSNHDGLFYPLTKMGYHVAKGEKVGYITDYLGEVKEEVRAPFSGIILYIINTPPISKGEPLFEVGKAKPILK